MTTVIKSILPLFQPNTSAHSDASSRPVPPYKPAPPYQPSPGQHQPSPGQRKLPPTPNRTSPYGISPYDTRSRSSPLKDYHQRMPEIQECRDSTTDLARSRSKLTYSSGDYMSQDYRNSDRNYVDVQNISCESPRTPTSHRANLSRSFQGHNQGDVTSASSKDSGNYSYHDRTIGESPVDIRNSPLNCRNSPYEFRADPRRGLDGYDKPPTVDIPSQYDEIAMFKNHEPPSQVSSSTDSGYGHNLFEKMLEHRLSGKFKTKKKLNRVIITAINLSI